MSANREWYGTLARDLVTRGEWKAFCKATDRKDESLRQESPGTKQRILQSIMTAVFPLSKSSRMLRA